MKADEVRMALNEGAKITLEMNDGLFFLPVLKADEPTIRFRRASCQNRLVMSPPRLLAVSRMTDTAKLWLKEKIYTRKSHHIVSGGECVTSRVTAVAIRTSRTCGWHSE